MRFLILFLISLPAMAQPIIPAYRSPGGTNWWVTAGVEGGIPAHDNITTNVTLSPGVSAATISSALQNCPSNQCVHLSAGNYFLNGAITWFNNSPGTGNGVVLRGDGMGKTILIFTNSSFIQAPIEIDGANRWGNGFPDDQFTNNFVGGVLSGYTQGSSNLVLSVIGTNASIFSALFTNEIIVMDQVNDYPVNIIGWDGSFAPSAFELRNNGTRAQQQYFQIKGISNVTNITVWPPVYATNWQASLKPNVWWWGNGIRMCGVEDLTVSSTNYFAAGSSNSLNTASIFFWAADNCWLKNVRMYKNRYGVLNLNDKNITISGCFFDDSLFYGSGSYGFVSEASGDPLVENCAFNLISTPINPECSAGGVFAYNFVTNDIYASLTSTRFGASIQPHQAYDNFFLFEGNWGTSLTFDFIHGSQGYHTALRNRMTGFELSPQVFYLYPVNINASNWWMNIVGNVLGTTGKQTNYQYDALHVGAGNQYPATYTLGFLGDTYTPVGSVWDDTNVAFTILQHGNYDTATSTNGGIVWDKNTSNHTIPNSYYTARPSYFTAGFPWPPFEATTPTSSSPTNLPAFYIYLNSSNAVPPTITVQPGNQTVTAPGSGQFSVVATGPSKTYQWYKNSVAIGGANTTIYLTPPTTYPADNGAVFYVIVSNPYGSVQSFNATLTVNSATGNRGQVNKLNVGKAFINPH